MNRNICLHFHIFKNAGTTLEWILNRNFGNDAISKDTDYHSGILDNQIILDILKKKKNIKAISSHQIRFPLPKHEDINFIPILLIRHPIDRAFSIYNFQRKRTDADRPGIKKAKELNLNDYIKWNLKMKKFTPMKNFQVLYLSDKPVSSIVDEIDYNLSLKRLKESKIIGVVDRFDESLVVAEEILGEYYPKIDLAYVKQNISNRNENLEQKLEEGKKRIKPDTMKELVENNSYDLKLYSKANQELNQRIKLVVEFETKLLEFKKRCSEIN